MFLLVILPNVYLKQSTLFIMCDAAFGSSIRSGTWPLTSYYVAFASWGEFNCDSTPVCHAHMFNLTCLMNLGGGRAHQVLKAPRLTDFDDFNVGGDLFPGNWTHRFCVFFRYFSTSAGLRCNIYRVLLTCYVHQTLLSLFWCSSSNHFVRGRPNTAISWGVLILGVRRATTRTLFEVPPTTASHKVVIMGIVGD